MLGFDYCMISGLLHQELMSQNLGSPSSTKSATDHRLAVLCTSAMLSCSFFEGCKEELKDPFGHLHITYSAKFSPDCTWTIENSGISKPVAIVSIGEVQFGYCR